MTRKESGKWITAMEDELKSMNIMKSGIQLKLSEGFEPSGCKWGFKTKKDSKGRKLL